MDIERCASYLPRILPDPLSHNRYVTDALRDRAHIREISRVSFTLGFFNQKRWLAPSSAKLVYNVFATFVSDLQKLKHFLNKSFFNALRAVTPLGNHCPELAAKSRKTTKLGWHLGWLPAGFGCSHSSHYRRFHPPFPVQRASHAPSHTRCLRSDERQPSHG